ncbi:MAG: TRC40/GET3/ArsA family transport-energizing ATPase [Thermodesulfobacteriota bacterium]
MGMSKLNQEVSPSPKTGPRIILFTGKGGVGKTSTAAATAVLAAQRGVGTLILSTDAAHSLSDSFDLPVGPTPTLVSDRLWALEIDVNRQLSKNWGPIHGFLHKFLRSRGFDSIIADELAILPGLEEIFSLLEVKDHAADPRFGLIIIDCAPTADTARLLALPDIARWYMEKIFHLERAVVRTVRPVAERFLDVPLPTDDVFAAVEKLYHHIMAVKKLLTDRDKASIRMVVNAEKMVIKEALRAYTFLSIFDFGIDAVIINRLLPAEIKDPYYGKWHEIQAEHLKFIHDSFEPLPLLTARLWDREIVGLELLADLGREIYRDRDPAEVLHRERAIRITPQDGRYILGLPVPFAGRDELETWVHGDELVIKYKNFRRNIVLPRALSNLKLLGAEFKGQSLNLIFGGEK